MELKISRLVNQQTNIDQGRVGKLAKEETSFHRRKKFMSLLSLSMRVTDRAECMHIGKNAPAFISEQNAHNRGEEMVFSRSNIHTNTIFFFSFYV